MQPLGMEQSAGVFQRLNDKSNIASPHAIEDGKLKELGHYLKNDESLGAAGGIYASVNDLTNWLFLHLNNGMYGKDLDKQLISKRNHAELWKAHTNMAFNVEPPPPYKSHFTAYGLGWNLVDRAGHVVVEHTGGLPGMLSRTMLIPELNVGIVVLTNADPGGYSFYTIPSAIMDAYLGVEDNDWLARAEKRIKDRGAKTDSVTTAVWNIVSKSKKTKINHEDFIGSYKDNWFGDIEIWSKVGELWFKSLRSPKLTGQMFFYQANTFAIKWNYQDMPCDAFAMFNLDENGKAISIKMKGISPNIDFSYDFHDLDLKRVD